MSLVRIAMPETETHLVLIASALEAAEIPFFVHNNGMGGLMPGLQIGAYNTRSVMVPQSCVEPALEAISTLQPLTLPAPTGGDKLRILAEALLLGWFIPGGRRRRQAAADDAVAAEPVADIQESPNGPNPAPP
jgi:hypothetical protein